MATRAYVPETTTFIIQRFNTTKAQMGNKRFAHDCGHVEIVGLIGNNLCAAYIIKFSTIRHFSNVINTFIAEFWQVTQQKT